MLLAARPCTKARKDFPALVRPVAVRQRAPASDAMSMSAEPAGCLGSIVREVPSWDRAVGM